MSRDMTNSEAIANLNHMYGMVSPNIQRSLDVAFKALEERPQGEIKKYKPLELDYNVQCAVENLKTAYWSNDSEKYAKVYTEADAMICSAICHYGYSVCKQLQGEWIPVSKELPNKNGWYICTCRDICENRVHTVGFDGVRKEWGRGGVIAWQPLPEPYKGGDAAIQKPNCVTCDHFGDCDGCEKGEEE